MNTRAHSQAKSSSTPSFIPAPVNLVQRKCACGGSAGLSGECDACQKDKLVGDNEPLIQPKLKISQPNDPYEQEADRVADEVMRIPEPRVQRQVGPEEEEDDETVQRKPIAGQITPLAQRQVVEEEDDETKGLVKPNTISPIATSNSSIQNYFLNNLGSGQPLDAKTRSFFEPRLGHDLSYVRIYANNLAAESAHSIQAKAYTIGRNVVCGAGEYAPSTTYGQRLLAHELVHVLQQENKSNGSDSAIHRTAQQGTLEQAKLDITELDTPVSLPTIIEPKEYNQTPTRELVFVVNPNPAFEGRASSEIRNPFLVKPEGDSYRLGFTYVLTVNPDLAFGGKHWSHDDVSIGGTIPALKPHEETHFRLDQLALRTQFERDPRTKNMMSKSDAANLVGDVLKAAQPLRNFISDKYDVKTSHGSDFRPQKRWEYETRHQREIRRAESLQKRNPKRFNRIRKRFNDSSNINLQPKLKINQLNDPYEQETDRIAEEVMRMPSSIAKRQEVYEEKERELLQRHPAIVEDAEKKLRAKDTTSQGITFIPPIETSIQSFRYNNGRPLDPTTRAFMEPRFGHDFSQVRVHTDSRAVRAVNARAFTFGNDIVLGDDQFNLGPTERQRLLAHELAHVVQQEGAQQSAVTTEPGSSPEVEANRAADRVMRGELIGNLTPTGIGLARYESGHEKARDLIEYLRAISNEEAALLIEDLTDSRYLRVVSNELSDRIIRRHETSSESKKLKKLHLLVESRLSVIKATSPFKGFKDDFEDLVKRIIRRTKGTRVSASDEKELRLLLGSLDIQDVKELEKIIILSSDVVGHAGKTAHIIEIVTSFSRTTSTSKEESERGRFVNGDIKDELVSAAAAFDTNNCWNFLFQQGLEILYADKQKVIAAQAAYKKGADERGKKTVHGAQTLSRGAAELRLQGLLGPINVLRWKGSHETGHHEPSPAKVVTDLSNAGDGWYFFFASVVSNHTLIIAVEVANLDRKYFVIQAGGKGKMVTEEKLNEEFNDHDPTRGDPRRKHTSHVGSRIWQVYTKATL